RAGRAAWRAGRRCSDATGGACRAGPAAARRVTPGAHGLAEVEEFQAATSRESLISVQGPGGGRSIPTAPGSAATIAAAPAATVAANRQRIVQSRSCFFRHRITAMNVWGNRQRPRGLGVG